MRRNIWWLTFLLIFTIGFSLIVGYCYLKDGFTLLSLTIGDWLNYLAACGTVGGFLYLLLDKVLSEKEENHVKWQSEIPYISLASPCDPTLNYCDIDILNNASGYGGRGNEYFSVCNLSKVNAYDISILFSNDEKFETPTIFNRHYINHLLPLQAFSSFYTDFSQQQVNGGSTLIPTIQQTVTYNFRDIIYSNYNVDPTTKQISNTPFDLCSSIGNCNLIANSANEKYFFVRFIYFSSFAHSRYRVQSDFKAQVICNPLPSPAAGSPNQNIMVKGITLLNYAYDFISQKNTK